MPMAHSDSAVWGKLADLEGKAQQLAQDGLRAHKEHHRGPYPSQGICEQGCVRERAYYPPK